MEKLTFRKAEASDIPKLKDLRIAYIKSDYGEIDSAAETAVRNQLEEYFPEHLNKDLFAFVCFDGEKAVSVVLLFVTVKPAFIGFLSGKTGTLLNVYTCPEYRRKGIAEKLVRMAIDTAEKNGLDFVELQATEDGAPLYRKVGFLKKESRYTPMKYIFEKERAKE